MAFPPRAPRGAFNPRFKKEQQAGTPHQPHDKSTPGTIGWRQCRQ